MIYILELLTNKLIEVEIEFAKSNEMPLKRNAWNFNWRKLIKEENTKTYILKIKETPDVEGVLQLKIKNNMLIMDVIEIAPHNIGKNKKYDYVAGCLIAFACRESFKIDGNYKGFLTFVSKTNLIRWYSVKYGAELALGQRMFIDSNKGLVLIKKYLKRDKKR